MTSSKGDTDLEPHNGDGDGEIYYYYYLLVCMPSKNGESIDCWNGNWYDGSRMKVCCLWINRMTCWAAVYLLSVGGSGRLEEGRRRSRPALTGWLLCLIGRLRCRLLLLVGRLSGRLLVRWLGGRLLIGRLLNGLGHSLAWGSGRTLGTNWTLRSWLTYCFKTKSVYTNYSIDSRALSHYRERLGFH